MVVNWSPVVAGLISTQTETNWSKRCFTEQLFAVALLCIRHSLTHFAPMVPSIAMVSSISFRVLESNKINGNIAVKLVNEGAEKISSKVF